MTESSYSDVQRVLAQSRSLTEAAEAHGTLSGALCTADSYRLEDWFGEIFPEGRAQGDGGQLLQTLFNDTQVALAEGAAEFAPLLPGDEDSIDSRTTALGLWCHGFLYGLGTGRLPDMASLEGEVQEILQDLTEIARVGVDPTESLESNESAYAELVEFVRIGVQVLFEHLRPLRTDPSGSAEPHSPVPSQPGAGGRLH